MTRPPRPIYTRLYPKATDEFNRIMRRRRHRPEIIISLCAIALTLLLIAYIACG